MTYKNFIIYLLGFPGVGKRTIATEICKHPNFRLVCNHTINNVVFPFVRVDSHTKMPTEIWPRTDQVRKIALQTLVDLGNRDFSYVFTNNFMEGDAGDLKAFKKLEQAAHKIDAAFLPVRLVCDLEENKKRVQNVGRDALMNQTNPAHLDMLQGQETLKPDTPNTITLDVTNLTPETAAKQILDHI